MQLCLFHVMRSKSREITMDKMGVRSGQRDALLAIFGAMATAAPTLFSSSSAHCWSRWLLLFSYALPYKTSMPHIKKSGQL